MFIDPVPSVQALTFPPNSSERQARRKERDQILVEAISAVTTDPEMQAAMSDVLNSARLLQQFVDRLDLTPHTCEARIIEGEALDRASNVLYAYDETAAAHARLQAAQAESASADTALHNVRTRLMAYLPPGASMEGHEELMQADDAQTEAHEKERHGTFCCY